MNTRPNHTYKDTVHSGTYTIVVPNCVKVKKLTHLTDYRRQDLPHKTRVKNLNIFIFTSLWRMAVSGFGDLSTVRTVMNLSFASDSGGRL